MPATMPYTQGWRDVRRKPSGKYEARWADAAGRARGKTFHDKAQAQKYADTMAGRAGNIAAGLPIAHMPIAEAVRAFLERRLNPKTTALNERRIGEFLALMPDVHFVEDLTDSVINQFDAKLEATGHNPGGRNHVLKIVRALCKFCTKKHFLGTTPFADFKMPKSDFEGRPLTEDEFSLMCSVGWVGSNQTAADHGIGWVGTNQYADVDLWLRRAFILGRETMLRISQVWKLTPADFHAPDQLRVEGIKGQETVTITLTPAALAVVSDLLASCKQDERLFSYWATLEAMREAVYKKGLRVGLRKAGSDWPRFHDIGKVTRVSQLTKAGFDIAEVEHLSNTTKRTLLAHYIKANRQKSFEKYKAFSVGNSVDNAGGRLVTRPTPDLQGTELPGNCGIMGEATGTEGINGK